MTDRSPFADIGNVCGRYCIHGGTCTLTRNHDGLHDSGYCKWPDEECLTKEQADQAIAGKIDDPVIEAIVRFFT